MLCKRLPTAVAVMDAARDDLLTQCCIEDFVYLHVPQEHWRKLWSTKPLERLNVAPRGALRSAEIKRRSNEVVIFPKDAAIVRLASSQLLEQQQERQLESLRVFSEATMAKIPGPEEALELTDGHPFAQSAAGTSCATTSPPLDLHRIPDN
jgi:putative transposase